VFHYLPYIIFGKNIKPHTDPSNIGLAVLSFGYPAFGIDNFFPCAYKINHFQAN
jgi:hypothetical protein